MLSPKPCADARHLGRSDSIASPKGGKLREESLSLDDILLRRIRRRPPPPPLIHGVYDDHFEKLRVLKEWHENGVVYDEVVKDLQKQILLEAFRLSVRR